MFPHPYGFDHRVAPDLHQILEERRPLRRSVPERLIFAPAGEVFASFVPPPVPSRPSATLYDLARDPRFARGALAPRPGLRQRIGQVFLWLGWALVRPGRT